MRAATSSTVASPAQKARATAPYQATPAFTCGLCAAYIHVMRPPQQKPVIPSRAALPPLVAAHCVAASRSAITCASGTRTTISPISVSMSL
jgi:hypothetical protein